MKKSMPVLAGLALLYAIAWPQTTFLVGGAGLHPTMSDRDSFTISQSFLYHNHEGIFKNSVGSKGGMGYQAFFGVGNEFRLNHNWHIVELLKLQFSVLTLTTREWDYDLLQPEDLVAVWTTKKNAQNLNLQLSINASRKLSWPGKYWQVFGGAYIRFKLGEKIKTEEVKASYYADIITGSKFDSLTGNYHDVIISKCKLEVPIETEIRDLDGGKLPFEQINYGIDGGIRFPITKASGWSFSGEARFSQDLNLAIAQQPNSTAYRFATLSVGLLISPDVAGEQHNGFAQPLDSLGNNSTDKKLMPLKGFQNGVSQHEILFCSLNLGYYTGNRFGIDASMRKFVPFFLPVYSVFIGPVYRIGDSRFFAKAGPELFHYDPKDEESNDETYVLAFIGGKYLHPLSNNIGLLLETGTYMGFEDHDQFRIAPALGIGFVFARFGR